MKVSKNKFWLVLADLSLLLMCFKGSELICQHIFGKNIGLLGGVYNALLYLLGSLFILVIFEFNNLYQLNIVLTRTMQFIALVRSFFYGIVTLIILSFVLKLSFIFNSRTFLSLYAVIGTMTMIVFRLFVVRTMYRTLSRGRTLKSNVIVIGAGHGGQLLAEKLVMEEVWGMIVVGFVDDDPSLTGTTINELPVLGTTHDIRRLVAEHNVRELIVAIDKISHQRLMGLMDLYRELPVRIKLTSELFNVVHKYLITEKYAGISMVDFSSKYAVNSYYLLYKRLFDVVVSTVGLILLFPLLAVIAILIKTTSPGSLIHRQVRIGKDGVPFDFYKFRSMTIASDGDPERQRQMIEFIRKSTKPSAGNGKIVNERRITWIGRIIRKMSLDELPQLVNVLKGDMSIVGPRPCLPYEYEHFEDWQRKRTAILPGCTGLWQVTGRGHVSFNDSVVLDLYYIKNMSPWLDLLLILKTIPVMILAKSTK